MHLKTKKIILCCLIYFLGSFYSEQSLAGGGYSDYSDLLIDGLIGYLIKHKICDSDRSCGKMIQTRTEGSKRIYINMYGQTNTIVTSNAVAFFIEEALKISEGTPVTLSAYPKPNDEYMNKGFKYAFGNKEYLINLALNKGSDNVS